MHEFMREFAHKFVGEFFANFVHEFKYEIHMNSYEFFSRKIGYVMNGLYCNQAAKYTTKIVLKFSEPRNEEQIYTTLENCYHYSHHRKPNHKAI